jgi:hypothetical protein
MTSNQPLEPESVEYLENPPGEIRGPQNRTGMPHTIVYQSDGLPCCSGCGCLLMCLIALFALKWGPLFTGTLVFLSAAVLAASALRLCGVHRYSPFYAYALVPVFLSSLKLSAQVFKGSFDFTWMQVGGATLIIYAFLYMARGLGRR